MKISLCVGLIGFMVLLGGCNTTSTPQGEQPGVQEAGGQPEQPGQPEQTAPSSDEDSDTTDYAPPALPEYEQPPIPDPGDIWTPGYWAWSSDDRDYYWVPGTWAQPPEAGVLWTPGYWGWEGRAFRWHHGYWAPHVGFYGGVNYGYGYTGDGYQGGRWNHGSFFYNRSVNNISHATKITNVYNETVVNNVTINRVSYNGGEGGITAQPTAAQKAGQGERHIPRTTEQIQHQHAASTNRTLLASVNRGKPPIAATAKPGAFRGGAVVAAKAAPPYHPMQVHPQNAPRPQVAQPNNEPHPQGVQPRNEPRPQAVQPKNEPRPQIVQPKNEPRPQIVQPKNESRPQVVQPKNEPRPQVVQPKNAPRPQEVQPKSEPSPKKAQHPSDEKTKDEREPSH